MIPLTAGAPTGADTGRLVPLEIGMKTVFGLAVIARLRRHARGAHFVPWLAHARLPSQTTGGRQRRARRAIPDPPAGGPHRGHGCRGRRAARRQRRPVRCCCRRNSSPSRCSSSTSRFADAGGNVVGVAARHWNARAARGATTTWSLLDSEPWRDGLERARRATRRARGRAASGRATAPARRGTAKSPCR